MAVLGIHEGFFSDSPSPMVVKSQLARGGPMAVHSPGSALAPQSPTHKQERQDFTNSLPKLDPPIPLHSCQVLEKVGKNKPSLDICVGLFTSNLLPRKKQLEACREAMLLLVGGRGRGGFPTAGFSLSHCKVLPHGLTLWTSEGPDPANGGESC